MNEKLNEILSDVWHRSISADEGFDAICDLIEQSAEIARLEAENKSLKDELAECKRDAEIGKLVREKLTSGNNIPVERCTVRASEISDIDQAIAKGKEE